MCTAQCFEHYIFSYSVVGIPGAFVDYCIVGTDPSVL